MADNFFVCPSGFECCGSISPSFQECCDPSICEECTGSGCAPAPGDGDGAACSKNCECLSGFCDGAPFGFCETP